MHMPPTEPARYHICVLNDDEVELLERARQWAAWKPAFLIQLRALIADDAVYNALARAVARYPSAFESAGGRPMTFEQWATAIRFGWWHAPGIGAAKLRMIALSLDTVSSDELSAFALRRNDGPGR